MRFDENAKVVGISSDSIGGWWHLEDGCKHSMSDEDLRDALSTLRTIRNRRKAAWAWESCGYVWVRFKWWVSGALSAASFWAAELVRNTMRRFIWGVECRSNPGSHKRQ